MLVAFAFTEGTPTAVSAGNEIRVPPPATVPETVTFPIGAGFGSSVRATGGAGTWPPARLRASVASGEITF